MSNRVGKGFVVLCCLVVVGCGGGSGSEETETFIPDFRVEHRFDLVRFGVDWRNGAIQPWHYGVGPPPASLPPPHNFQEKAFLEGEFVGLTPAALIVVGDVSLVVNLDSPTDAELHVFNLKYEETDDPFGDEMLRYRLDIDHGTLSYLGDDGTIEGRFVGSSFDLSFAGSLEREEIIGAFGGVRQLSHASD